MKEIVKQISDKIQSQFENDASGHDWFHIQRVVGLSKLIQKTEGGDLEVIELAALLHDISDHKFNGGKLDEGGKVAREILSEFNYPKDKTDQVCYIIDNVSYKGADTSFEMNSLEGQIVQDADRIDAIGAIGIGRTFAYGGHSGQAMYDPRIKPKLHKSFKDYSESKTTTINHFHEKLLLLKDRLNTPTGKSLGLERHQLMEDFLQSFYNEWNINEH